MGFGWFGYWLVWPFVREKVLTVGSPQGPGAVSLAPTPMAGHATIRRMLCRVKEARFIWLSFPSTNRRKGALRKKMVKTRQTGRVTGMVFEIDESKRQIDEAKPRITEASWVTYLVVFKNQLGVLAFLLVGWGDCERNQLTTACYPERSLRSEGPRIKGEKWSLPDDLMGFESPKTILWESIFGCDLH